MRLHDKKKVLKQLKGDLELETVNWRKYDHIQIYIISKFILLHFFWPKVKLVLFNL
jgi:hypothetical protein